MKKLTVVAVMVLLFLLFPRQAAGMENPLFDPSAPPGLPSQLSPLIPLTPPPAPRSETHSVQVNYDLPAGWSVISFPLARIDFSSGFTRMLLYYDAGNYYPVDPVHSPSSLNPRLAYLSYSEKPVKVKVSGIANEREVSSISLAPGWNLIGCPFSQKLYWHRMTFSREQATRALETAAGSSHSSSGNNWISSFAFDFDGRISGRNLLNPDASLDPMHGLWVFAWHPLLLNLNLMVASSPPGNLAPVSVTPATQPSAGGTLSGKVENNSGNPLKGARLSLDSGQSTISLNDGSYILTGISPGPHRLSTTLMGYREATGQVSVEPGKSKSVLVSLSPLFAASGANPQAPGRTSGSYSSEKSREPQKGTLHLIAHPYYESSRRCWVSRISAYALGDSGLSWTKSWDSDLGDASSQLNCTGAVVGKTYHIRVEWKRGRRASTLTNTWDRTMRRGGQTETFDSP
ncbi:MAG: carboxypeptidase-like regulatory domain-containing protein [bacterium]